MGTFAMNKAYFLEVGGFDDGLQKWGGENIDLALRVSEPAFLIIIIAGSPISWSQISHITDNVP